MNAVRHAIPCARIWIAVHVKCMWGDEGRQARHPLCPWKKASQMVLFGTGAGAGAATVAPVAIASGAAGGGDAARDGDGPAVSVSFVIRSASPKPSCHALIPWSVSGNDAHDGAAVAGAGAVVGASPPPTNRNNAPRPPRAASCAFVLVSCTACPMPETP